MSKDKKIPKPPPGIKPDYSRVYNVGTYGPLDEKAVAQVLYAELNPRFSEAAAAIEQSWSYIQQLQGTKDFLRAYGAFREITDIYPMTAKNWHSGERIPLVHAGEIAHDAITIAFQAHYKHAYQNLREILELVTLQVHFYTIMDKSIIGQWGRGEIWTPSLRSMLKQLASHHLYKIANDELSISREISAIYDELGAYVHTRGVPTTHMGLSGSNIATFVIESLERFFTLFYRVSHLSVILLTVFFPAAIIYTHAFEKFGHLAPIWLPRKDHVSAIRAILSDAELQTLENLANLNMRFHKILGKVNALPNLSEDEIHETYDRLESASNQGVEELTQIFKEINKIIE